MIELSADCIHLSPDQGTWEAVYLANRLTGPETLAVAGHELIRGCETWLNDIVDSSAVVTDFRAVRRSGAAVVTTSGYLPFGNPIQFRQQTVHAGNHARTTLDIQWPVEARVRKRFGIASLFLPGRWQRFFCVAPAASVAADATPAWTAVPAPDASALPLILGQWRRPPLALVLEREDGTRFETGTGSDLWRWEHAFGHGAESGNYRLVLESGGLRFLREPLVCAAEFVPDDRKFRLTWYAAWDRLSGAAEKSSPTDIVALGFAADAGLKLGASTDGTLTRPSPAKILLLDFGRMPVRADWCRLTDSSPSGEALRLPSPCWEENAVQKRARHAFRQLAAWSASGRLLLRGLTPGICQDARHVGKRGQHRLIHWDINGILDLAEWARRTLGPGWEVTADIPAPWSELPSLRRLFEPSGFAASDAEVPEIEPTE